jgi:hypothetical protein
MYMYDCVNKRAGVRPRVWDNYHVELSYTGWVGHQGTIGSGLKDIGPVKTAGDRCRQDM